MGKRMTKKATKADRAPAGRARTKRSFMEKLRPDQKPSKTRDPRDGRTMLIPTPLLVAEQIQKTKKGELITPDEIRNGLARRHKAAKTCPLVTGIFLNIIAGAAEEAIALGKRPIAPYWRVVDKKGRLPEKFPPGVVRQAEHLAREGIVAVKSGRAGKLAVMGFEARKSGEE